VIDLEKVCKCGVDIAFNDTSICT